VRKAFAASRESVQPMSAWASGFRAEVAPHAAKARALAGEQRGARPFVLVVEDDAFAAKLIGKALEHPAFDLQYASNAPAVLSLVRAARPLVILMDVNLPGMDGLSLTEWLKASPTLAQIPVIMLTGDTRRETIDRSKNAGAVGFIVKPFTRDGLLGKLAPYLP
jgi:CheY-like chemotaxis protein